MGCAVHSPALRRHKAAVERARWCVGGPAGDHFSLHGRIRPGSAHVHHAALPGPAGVVGLLERPGARKSSYLVACVLARDDPRRANPLPLLSAVACHNAVSLVGLPAAPQGQMVGDRRPVLAIGRGWSLDGALSGRASILLQGRTRRKCLRPCLQLEQNHAYLVVGRDGGSATTTWRLCSNGAGLAAYLARGLVVQTCAATGRPCLDAVGTDLGCAASCCACDPLRCAGPTPGVRSHPGPCFHGPGAVGAAPPGAHRAGSGYPDRSLRFLFGPGNPLYVGQW